MSGQDLHFAPGKYSPASSHGQELIGHELAHVVQQRAGRVAVPQGKGAPINADPALEAEADQLGKKAAHERSAVAKGLDGSSPVAPGMKSTTAKSRSSNGGSLHSSSLMTAAVPATSGTSSGAPIQCNGLETLLKTAQEKGPLGRGLQALAAAHSQSSSDIAKPPPKLTYRQKQEQARAEELTELRRKNAEPEPEEGSFDWSTVHDDELPALQEHVLEHGIRPMLAEHLTTEQMETMDSRIADKKGKFKAFSKDEFGYRSAAFALRHQKGMEHYSENPSLAATSSLAQIQSDLGKLPDDNVATYRSVGEGLQGQAFGEYQTINKASALKEQGMHLLVHETMHTLAHPGWAQSLADKHGEKTDQTFAEDEAHNEYFARLATERLRGAGAPGIAAGGEQKALKDILGSHKLAIGDLGLQDAKDKLSNTHGSGGKGVYGDFLEQHKLAGDLEHGKIKEKAEKYFLSP